MKTTVSLCLIVKNESDCLARCLESFKDVIDEICILDTGSTDNTVEIALKYGARVELFDWCDDFSKARNQNIKMAKSDWIIVVDADEYLNQDDVSTLINALSKVEYDGFLIKTLNFHQPGTQNYIVNLNQRIFKNNGNFYYKGRIHEQIVAVDNSLRKGGFLPLEVGFYHTGYLKDVRQAKKKNERNLTILENVVRDEPATMFTLFNLANEYSNMKGYEDKSLELYNKAYSFREYNAGFMPKLMVFRIQALLRAKKIDSALEAIEEGLKIFPTFTELVYQRALIEKERNLILKSINSFEECKIMGKPEAKLEFTTKSYEFGPSFYLGEIYYQQQMYKKAYLNYLDALKIDPTKFTLLNVMTDCLLNLGENPVRIVELISHFFDLHQRSHVIYFGNLMNNKNLFPYVLMYFKKDIKRYTMDEKNEILSLLKGLNFSTK